MTATFTASYPFASNYPFDWHPNSGNDRRFWLVLSLCLGASFVLSLLMATQVVPPAPPQTQAPVAPRIVNFMSNRPKPAIPIPAPKPLTTPPPRIIKTRPTATPAPQATPEITPEQAPVTPPAEPASIGRTRPAAALDSTKASARARAQNTGLLALGGQVSSLLATAPSSQVLAQTANAAVASAAEQTPSDLESRRQVELSAAPAARVDTQALDQQAVQNSAQNVKQALSHAAQGAAVSGGGRSDKDIAGVFAQHQPSLHKVYERARRQTPGLAGKLVLEFAIAADGSVSSLRVVASELNNSELEASIISRVKQFRFAAGKPQTGVRYAMEFLP